MGSLILKMISLLNDGLSYPKQKAENKWKSGERTMSDEERRYLESLLKAVENKLYMSKEQIVLIAMTHDKLYLLQQMLRERLGLGE